MSGAIPPLPLRLHGVVLSWAHGQLYLYLPMQILLYRAKKSIWTWVRSHGRERNCILKSFMIYTLLHMLCTEGGGEGQEI
jgi:hypothetical protein